MEKEYQGGVEDPLYILRHSTAHLLAAAVVDLFPGARYAIGPPVQDGFYYDFELPQRISDDDLPRIEARMREIAAQDPPFEQVMLPRSEAVRLFEELGQIYKLEILENEAAGDEILSLYRTGSFLDLCRGPHVPSAGQLQHFKLMRVAGAYWRGDERRPQLQRIYGTAWPDLAGLEAYLAALAEAEARDHKRLGRELKLFALDDRSGAGMPLWLPAGATVRRELERWIVDEEVARGYQHVVTPHVARLDTYRTSGHYPLYKDVMFAPMIFEDGEELQLRPMNCPHHAMVYQQELRSYRDLPLRIAELGQNYRYERSGELMGMIRVRSFCLNDAHVFCTLDQLGTVILEMFEIIRHYQDTIGMDQWWPRLSTRDTEKTKWTGTDEEWATGEAALRQALEQLGLEYELGEGEAAFYGPKIDFQVRDALRREFTNNTIQVDFQLAQRFDLEYVAEDGSRQRPVVVHRGGLGSMERVMAYLIEKYAGAFPTWLAPVQVVVIPITDSQFGFSEEIATRLRRGRLRVEVDTRSERMNRKIRDAQARKVPYMLVVGPREAESRAVSVRTREGAQWTEAVANFAAELAAEVAERRLRLRQAPAAT